MTNFWPGLVHTPVTPFTADLRIDYAAYAKVLDFHIRNGAEALALPMHLGESVSLSDMEKRALLEFALGHVGTRVPVISHVSDSGTVIALARAKHAESLGVAALVVSTPYYWTPPAAMLVEHFAQIGAAVRLPFFVHNAPDDMAGVKINADLVLELAERRPNFAGVVDSGLDWQFMIEVISEARRLKPDFQLISGTEYMVSTGAIGGRGMFSSLAGIAPHLVRHLHDLCAAEKFVDARRPQEALAALRQMVKAGGVSSLKAAMRIMGRDAGAPRPPNDALADPEASRLAADLATLPALGVEPRGW
jgi:4-hydroxy-tetrahydrodipicolinate synthase